MKKKRHFIYAKPEVGKEEFTRHIFSQHSLELGYEITNIQKKFPDCTAIDQKRNKIVYIEFEYEAKSFISHGHHEQILNEKKENPDSNKEYIVVCWSDKGAERVRELGYKVITLKKALDITIKEIPDTIEQIIEKPLYKVIGYNAEYASGKEFSDFENVRVFRTNIKFKNNRLPKGSVIILCEDKKLIGEFTIVKHLHFEDAPRNEREKQFYQLLTYPVSIFDNPISSVRNKWVKGYMIFTNFQIYEPKVPLKVIGKSRGPQGSYNISYEMYLKIRGKI